MSTSIPNEFHASAVPGAKGPAQFWSVSRLQFNSKPVTRAMVQSIRSVIGSLDAQPGQILHAIYTSAVRDLVDAENVLIYNVGVGSFRRAARFGLRFERCFNQCPLSECDWQALHHMTYEVAEQSIPPRHWTPGRAIVSWLPHAIPPLEEFIKPHRIWFALKPQQFTMHATSLPQYFGIRLQVEMGRRGSHNPAAFLKSLLDAIISLFHAHDGTEIDLVAERLALASGLPADSVKALLLDSTNAVLGTRRLVWPRHGFIQWNPEDDACVCAEVIAHEGLQWRCSGEIFEVQPRA